MAWAKKAAVRAALGLGLASVLLLFVGRMDSGGAQVSDDWCARVMGGPAGAQALAVDLSLAHAEIRFFGFAKEYRDVDQALAEALTPADALTSSRGLERYAELLESVCFVAANNTSLGPARVESIGTIALITPGTGTITLPTGTTAVAVDLRGLPSVGELRTALEAAVALALKQPVPRAVHRVRKHTGMTDEYFTRESVYSNEVVGLQQDPIPGRGNTDLPLIFLTGPRMAPEAAELAGTLRFARRAWIVGEDVPAAVAEARWRGIGEAGLVYRRVELFQEGSRWPDVIRADRRMGDLAQILPELARESAPRTFITGENARTKLLQMTPFGKRQPNTLRLGDLRAALIVAHGATRLFFPYFHVVGDRIDERLLEVLTTVEQTTPLNRKAVRNLLRRFGEALRDGHNFVLDLRPDYEFGLFPVKLDQIGGEPVVRRSLVPEVKPGDTIISIDGQPAAEWYAQEYRRTSAATDGYRFELASHEFLYGIEKPTEFGLRDLDGMTRTVVIQPQPFDVLDKLGSAPSLRKSGYMTDLGAPNVYYINLSDDVLKSDEEFTRALRQASGAVGLVLDMRGYPGTLSQYRAVRHLITQGMIHSPIFRIPVLIGPNKRDTSDEKYEFEPLSDPSYSGPIMLLVGPQTVSAAENFSTMLVDAKRVTVVGRRSAGTNGNITGIQLPGAFAFSFTGMEVLHVDGSTFHGIGIVPNSEVQPKASDFRDGIDRDLQKAIELLSSSR